MNSKGLKRNVRSLSTSSANSVKKSIRKNSPSSSQQDRLSSSNENVKRYVKVWTPFEDKILSESYKQFNGNWKNIAESIEGRNSSQCSQRWKRTNPNRNKLRKQWSQEEDEQVKRLVQKFGRNWKRIEREMEGRNGKQIRERWINRLDNSINSEPFTYAEDQIILQQYQSDGPKWSEISKFMTGRPENMIKNRFYSHIKRIYLHNNDNQQDLSSDYEQDKDRGNLLQSDSQQINELNKQFAALHQLTTIQSVNEDINSYKVRENENGVLVQQFSLNDLLFPRGESQNQFLKIDSFEYNKVVNTQSQIQSKIFNHGSMSLELDPSITSPMNQLFDTNNCNYISIPMPQIEVQIYIRIQQQIFQPQLSTNTKLIIQGLCEKKSFQNENK